MKMKFTKALLLILSLCLLSALLASCGSNSESADYSNSISTPGESKGDGFTSEIGNGALPSQSGDYERKIIKNVTISAETKNFEGAIGCIETLCESVGGYIESSSVQGYKTEKEGSSRYANYTLRIPAERLNEFTDGLGNLINVISSSGNAEEVTSAYYDIQSRIAVLEMQKAALQEMYDTYTDYEDINYLMQLQDKLFEVIAEIEAYQTQIRLYDDRVAYSTVNMRISEVVDYTENEKEKGFFVRLGDSFMDGIRFFGNILNGLVTALAFLLPFLAVIAITVIVILLFTRKKRKAKKQRVQESVQDCSANKKE